MKPKALFGKSGGVVLAAAMVTTGYLWGSLDRSMDLDTGFVSDAEAAGGVVESPTGTTPDRYVDYPGTEEPGSEEIRVIACGTGLPAARRSQAATCFLIETGNGDKFLFDLGTGSMTNIASLMIPYEHLDKVFLSHLHTDHMGDLLGLRAGG